MRHAFGIYVVLLASGLGGEVAAQPFAGTWVLEFEHPDFGSGLTLVLIDDAPPVGGGLLQGASAFSGEAKEGGILRFAHPVRGTAWDGGLQFFIDAAPGRRAVLGRAKSLFFTGTADGDTMEGTMITMGPRVPFTGKRQDGGVLVSEPTTETLDDPAASPAELFERLAPEPAATNTSTDLTFQSVSVGPTHSCGLTTAGAAYCWGDRPVAVSDRLTFNSVSVGFRQSCGLTAAGEAYCWRSARPARARAAASPLPAARPFPVPGPARPRARGAGRGP